MQSNRKQIAKSNTSNSLTIPRQVLVVDPTGVIYTINGSVPEFCRSIPAFSSNVRQHYEGLARVIRGERISHKGWKLANGKII